MCHQVVIWPLCISICACLILFLIGFWHFNLQIKMPGFFCAPMKRNPFICAPPPPLFFYMSTRTPLSIFCSLLHVVNSDRNWGSCWLLAFFPLLIAEFGVSFSQACKADQMFSLSIFPSGRKFSFLIPSRVSMPFCTLWSIGIFPLFRLTFYLSLISFFWPFCARISLLAYPFADPGETELK